MPMPVLLAPREMLFGRVMPPERCSAPVAVWPGLRLAVTGIEIVFVATPPRALALVTRMTPPLMAVVPSQPVLLADMASTPLSSFSSAALAVAPMSKAVSSVKVLPGLTSMTLAADALPKRIWRPPTAKVRSSVTRRVGEAPVGLRTILLAGAPSWPSAEMARVPRLTTTSPVKSFAALPSARVPSPVLVSPLDPLILPLIRRPGVNIDWVALATW